MAVVLLLQLWGNVKCRVMDIISIMVFCGNGYCGIMAIVDLCFSLVTVFVELWH